MKLIWVHRFGALLRDLGAAVFVMSEIFNSNFRLNLSAPLSINFRESQIIALFILLRAQIGTRVSRN